MAIKISDIQLIGVNASSETWVVASFQTEEARYHFHLGKDGEPRDDVLYKNTHAAFGQAGYKECIRSNLLAKSNSRVLDHVMGVIREQGLAALAVKTFLDNEAAKRALANATRAAEIKQAYERWMHLRANEGLHPGDADFTQQVSEAGWLDLSALVLSGSPR